MNELPVNNLSSSPSQPIARLYPGILSPPRTLSPFPEEHHSFEAGQTDNLNPEDNKALPPKGRRGGVR